MSIFSPNRPRWFGMLGLLLLLNLNLADEPSKEQREQWLQARTSAIAKFFTYRSKGELDEALAPAKESIDLERKLFGEKLDPSNRNLEQLVHLLVDRGEWDAIAPLLQKVREARINEWGKEHVFVRELERIEADAKQVQEWKNPNKKKLRKLRQQTFQLQGDIQLGLKLYLSTGMGDPESTDAMATELVGANRLLWGKKHPETAMASMNLGIVFELLDKHDLARQQFAAAKEIFTATLGEDHPLSIRCEYHRGVSNWNNFKEAEASLQRAANAWAKHFGKENDFYLECQERLGRLYVLLQKQSEAEKVFRECLRLSAILFGADSFQVAQANRVLGTTLRKNGKAKESRDTLLIAMSLFEKHGGKEQPAYVVCVQELGRLAQSDKDLKATEESYRQAVKLASGLGGEHRRVHADALRELGTFLANERNNAKEAIPFLREATKIYRDLEGVKSIDGFSCLQMIARLHDELGEFDPSGVAWKEALEAIEAIQPQSNLNVTVLQFVASNARKRQDYSAAKKALDRAIPLAEKLNNDLAQIAELHEEAGMVYRNWWLAENGSTQLKAARDHFTKAVVGFEKLGKPLESRRFWATSQLGEVLIFLRDFPAAEESLNSARKFFEPRSKQHPQEYLATVVNQAQLETSREQFHAAIPHWKTAAEFVPQLPGDRRDQVELYLDAWSGAHQALQEYPEAEQILRRVQTLVRNRYGVEDPRYAKVLERIAFQRDSIGDTPGAKALYLQSLAIRKKKPGPDSLPYALTLLQVGKVQTELREWESAEKSLTETLELLRRLKGENDVLTADALEAAGWLSDAKGDRKTARNLVEQAMVTRRKAWGPDDNRTLSYANSLAARYTSWGDLSEAKNRYSEVAERRRVLSGVDGPAYGQTLLLLGDVLVQREEFAEAEKALVESLRIAEKNFGKSHPAVAVAQSFLGGLYWKKREPNKVIDCYRRAIDCWRESGQEGAQVARQWELLGIVLRGQHDELGSAKAFTESLAIRRRLLDDAFLRLDELQQLQASVAYRNTLDRYLGLGKLILVEEAYRQVLTWKGSVTLNQRAVQILHQNPELANLLKSKAEATSNLTRELLSTSEPEKRKDRSAFWQERVDEAERKLIEKSADYRSTKQTADEMLQAIRRSLPAKTALVDYLEYRPGDGVEEVPSANGRYVAFVVRPDRELVRIELGSSAEINRSVEAFRQDLSATEPAAKSDSHGVILRRAIWEKLEPHLEGAETVFISPDGELARLPFAALPGKDPKKFLLEERTLALVPVPQLLSEWVKWQAPKEEPQMLLLGAVDFDRRQPNEVAVENRQAVHGNAKIRWPALPKSRDEIDNIESAFRKRFDGGTVQKLSGSDATESVFRQRLGNPRYLHLATHGFFADPETRSINQVPVRNELFQALFESRTPGELIGHHPGLLSGIVFAGANLASEENGDDGILTALEVRDFNLSNTQLVVLSACESGLGKTAGGEGVLGLQRAFHLAGAKNVVCSYWRVSDEGTAAMMTLFYRKLWFEKKTPLEALREAQLQIMKQPELIPKLAKLRGIDFTEKELPEIRGADTSKNERASIKLWASFVLSGSGR